MALVGALARVRKLEANLIAADHPHRECASKLAGWVESMTATVKQGAEAKPASAPPKKTSEAALVPVAPPVQAPAPVVPTSKPADATPVVAPSPAPAASTVKQDADKGARTCAGRTKSGAKCMAHRASGSDYCR